MPIHMVDGSCQARDWIWAAAAASCSNTRSFHPRSWATELHLPLHSDPSCCSWIPIPMCHSGNSKNLHTFFFFFFFFFCFLGPHPRHTEVPRLGVESELHLLAYTTAPATSDPSSSVNYTTARGNAGSLTHWARPGIESETSWLLVGFISAVPQWELLNTFSLSSFPFS